VLEAGAGVLEIKDQELGIRGLPRGLGQQARRVGGQEQGVGAKCGRAKGELDGELELAFLTFITVRHMSRSNTFINIKYQPD